MRTSAISRAARRMTTLSMRQRSKAFRCSRLTDGSAQISGSRWPRATTFARSRGSIRSGPEAAVVVRRASASSARRSSKSAASQRRSRSAATVGGPCARTPAERGGTEWPAAPRPQSQPLPVPRRAIAATHRVSGRRACGCGARRPFVQRSPLAASSNGMPFSSHFTVMRSPFCTSGGLPIAWGKAVSRGKDDEGAADRRVGKSWPDPRTQVARPGRHTGHSRCSCATAFEQGSRVYRGVRPRPFEADGDISRLRLHRSHRRLARHPRRPREKNAYDFFDLNVRGTFEVFEAAASAHIGKVIFISTTSVYRPIRGTAAAKFSPN